MNVIDIKGCVWVLILFLMSCACKKQEMETGIQTDAQGVTIALPALWKSSVSKDGTLAYGVTTSVVHNGNVLCSGGEKGGKPLGNQSLVMKDSETGKDLWKWDDKLTTFEALYVSTPYQHEKYLVFQGGPRGYCLDLSDVRTVFQNTQGNQMRDVVKGFQDIFFLTGNVPESEQGQFEFDHWIFQGSFKSNIYIPIIRPPYSRKFVRRIPAGNVVGEASAPHPFVQGNDTLIAFAYWEPATVEKDDYFLGLFNLSKKKWVYDRKSIPGAWRTPYATGGNIVFESVGSVFCYRISDGETVWRNTSFQQNTGFDDLIIAENKLIGNNSDTYLYALDLETGKTLWKEKSNGSTSQLVYMDGVVYYVGGMVLHAVEVATGKHLWRLKSPDVAVNQGAFFFGFVAAVPGKNGKKGHIIANTGLNVYCYEAAR